MFACLLPVRPAFGIDPDRAMSQYIHDQWGPEEGLPHGSIYAITQTTDGYLWLGGENGLTRFDGWTFQAVKNDSGGTPISGVLGLTPDRDGCLWTLLLDKTIVRYCHESFEKRLTQLDLRTHVSTITHGNGGPLLAAKMETGVVQFRDGQFKLVASAADFPRSPILSLAQTPDGAVWLGTRDAGLFRVDRGRTTSIRDGLPDDKINCLLSASERDLWIGTDKGIVRWDGRQLTSAGVPRELAGVQVLSMIKDRDGNIWVGTDARGVLRLNSHGVTALKEGAGVRTAAITAIFEDREGSVWIGSADGLERLRDSAFVTFSLPEGLPADGSKPVFADRENRVWFSPENGGLWWMKDGLHGQVHAAGIDRDVIYSIAGGLDELWIGRKLGGLTVLHFQHGSVTGRTYTQADGLAQNSVYSVYLSREGAVWAGTLSGGVSRLSSGKLTTYTDANGLAANTVASILETADGTMWFATPAGLSALREGSWRSYGKSAGLPSDNVNCLFEDSRKILWVGTAAGLAFQDHSGFQLAAGPPALQEPIFGIAEDRFGWLWVSTSNRVLRVDRDRLRQGDPAEGELREYGPVDGVRGVEGVKRHRSVVTDPLGRIWFSMNSGISVVDPARLSRSFAPTITHVQAISADGLPVGLRDPVRIPKGRQRIVLNFVGLGLAAPERVRFRYRLDGYDRDWSAPTAARETTYTNLTPRPYRFRVIASNPDGSWTSAETAIPFEVQPELYQRFWFRLSMALAFAGTAWMLYRFRLRRLAARLNLRFQERLEERTRIAQELHDTLLQGFMSASMYLHVAADQLPAESPDAPLLARIVGSTRQVIEEGRNTVRGLRASRSVSLALDETFAQVPQELGIEEKIDFRVIVVGKPRPLHPLLRDEVYRIGREALINAFRHARATKIEMELQYSLLHFRVLVRDDGCGIDAQTVRSGREGHWGLPGMRERAERIGARLHVFSRMSAGTEIELSVPSRIAVRKELGYMLARWTKLFRRKQAPLVPQ